MPKSLLKAMLGFCIAVTVTSCDQNKTVDAPFDSLSQPVTYVVKRVSNVETVSLETATKVAERFLSPKRKTRSGASVDDTFIINDSEGNPACFVINYANNGGFVIVSAKKDVEPILAYSETGNFSMEVMENTGASILMEENKYLVEHADQLPDSVKLANRIIWEQLDYEEETLHLEYSRSYDDVYRLFMSQQEEWRNAGYEFWNLAEFKKTSMFASMSADDQWAITNLPYGNANKDYFGGVEHTTFVIAKDDSKMYDLRTSEWAQTCPYNMFVPNLDPLGCTTVAAGQIMRFHKYPKNLNWAEMYRNDKYPTATTAEFLYDLALKIGVEFKPGGSPASIVQVQNALKEYGYSSTRTKHSAGRVKTDIINSRPVYMRGSSIDITKPGHAWVCEGYTKTQTNPHYELWCLEDCPSGYEPTMFYCIYEWDPSSISILEHFYMNWGYYGQGNAWFSDSNIKMYNGNYCKDREDLTEIQHR